jgi:hypothetical protein
MGCYAYGTSPAKSALPLGEVSVALHWSLIATVTGFSA